MTCVLAFFRSVVAAQLCQNFVFLDFVTISLLLENYSCPLALLCLLLFMCSSFSPSFALTPLGSGHQPLCALRLIFPSNFVRPLGEMNGNSILWLGPMIHAVTLKLATPVLVTQRSSSGSLPPWSFNNAHNPYQHARTSFSHLLVKVSQ